MNQSRIAYFQFVLTIDTDYDVLNFSLHNVCTYKLCKKSVNSQNRKSDVFLSGKNVDYEE